MGHRVHPESEAMKPLLAAGAFMFVSVVAFVASLIVIGAYAGDGGYR